MDFWGEGEFLFTFFQLDEIRNGKIGGYLFS